MELLAPEGGCTPLVLDSPHSGSFYPADFHFICPKSWLRQTEDAHVDQLFAFAPALGIALLKANFTRNYVDVNRAEDDLEPSLLQGTYHHGLKPTERSRAGHGVIRHLCRGQPLYAEKLSLEQVRVRLAQCYHPYHAALKKLLQERQQAWGSVWHINCHSMPSKPFSEFARQALPDFVLGDRDGASCDPTFTHRIAEVLQGQGYRVAFNDPYKGVEIIRRYGWPRSGFHSLQLEINRALYMDEENLQPHEGFARLQTHLQQMLITLHAWIMERHTAHKMAAE